jgi:hypothetical protein
VASRWFGNRGHDCLGPRDFRCTVTAHGELQRMTVGCHVSVNGATLPLRNNKVQSSEKQHGEICWPDPRVRCLSRGGPGGHCRYPEDRVPPYTNSKSRQRTRRGLTHAHVFCGSSSYLLAQGSSGTATCPMALAPASWPRAALQPPRVPWLQLWPPGSRQLQRRHVSHGALRAMGY